MKAFRKIFCVLTAVVAFQAAPAFAFQTFENLSDKWGSKKQVPSSFAVLHYIHGSVETVILQEAIARKNNLGGVRLCKLFKEDGDLVEPEAEIVKKIVMRFSEAGKDGKYAEYSAPQMILMQLSDMYACPEKSR